MARMMPLLPDEKLDALRSRAEARFFRACRDQLGQRLLVLHSIPYITRLSGEPRDGEADFVIFLPENGFMVVEIKGGGVSYDPNERRWYSVNAARERNEIKDPFIQGSQEKHALLELIKRHRDWPKLGIGWLLAGHAVFLPDVDRVDPLVMPHGPREILGGRQDLDDLGSWLSKVIAYWQGEEPHSQSLGSRGMALIEEIFCKPREVRPLISAELREDEAAHIRLTEQQSRVLRALGRHGRAAICGGAGTGKTLLAVEKARQLAAEGCRTLLLCYNRPLADHLRYVIGDQPKLMCMSFHQLCEWKTREMAARTGRDVLEEAILAFPARDRFDYHLPYALAIALDEIPDPYDAVVVDEGQDFRDEFWFAVELLSNDASSRLYVFYDQNQAIYTRSSKFPIKDEPFLLTTNCRNTDFIHNAAYRYYEGDPIDPPGIRGAPVEVVPAASLSAQVGRIHSLVTRLIGEEQVAPEDVVVLVESTSKHYFYGQLEACTLPRRTRWSPEKHRAPNSVLVETMHRFKGLEAAIVILAGTDTLDPDRDRETLYVALSRPKSRLYLVGRPDACERILGVTLPLRTDAATR